MRVALGTNDGSKLGYHGGRVKYFYIYERTPEGWKLVEKRENPHREFVRQAGHGPGRGMGMGRGMGRGMGHGMGRGMGRGMGMGWGARHGHELLFSVLRDVDLVAVATAGEGIRAQAQAMGINFITLGRITLEEALRLIERGEAQDRGMWHADTHEH